MKRCEFCGSELPVNAQYCGNCGRMVADRYATATDITYPPVSGIPEPQTPPLFSSPMYPKIQSSGMEWQDTDSTFRTRWSVEDMQSFNPEFKDRKTDENETVIPDVLLPGMLAMQSQLPSPAQLPMVQGSPQFGGVPSVQGTPAAPGNVPQSIPGPAHGAASSAPSYAPQEPQSIPVHHQPVQHPVYHQSPQHQYQPVHHPQPTPPPHELEHKHQHRHDTGPLHTHNPHTSGLHKPATVASKAGMGVASKWLIAALAAVVVIATSSIFLAHALMPTTPPPALTISGTNVVQDGGILHLHGQGFQPGDGITLTIDNGLPVALSGQNGTQAVSQRTVRNAQVAGLSQMSIAGAFQRQSTVNTHITVSSSGTFDTTVTVPSGLPAGKHAIQAIGNQSSQRASLQFTVPSPQLSVNPTALDFGSVEVGRTVKLLVTLSNQGGAGLHWTATVEGPNTNWLTLSKSSSVLGTNSSSEPIVVAANANGLSVGSRTATLRFHTDNGDVQTAVKIQVISTGQSGQQAIMNISTPSIDFGQLKTGQLAQQSFSIANLGNLPLQWQASSDGASATWLSLATSKGTVQSGAVPQTVQVKVNTTGLVAGSYAGTITITSNGGRAQVKVTLVVTSPTVTPTATPKVSGISPASGSSNGGTNVTITGTGFTGATNISFGQTPASKFTAVSDTQITATSPVGSGTVDVTVTTPAGTSATGATDQFTHTTVVLPMVTSITPNNGQNGGGINVTIVGTGFTGATSVFFGQTAVSNFTVVSNTQITVTNPAGSGTVDVTVTTPTGTSATSTADQFTYKTPPPFVTGISPTSGSSNGGTNVTVTGTGFNGATGVSFGKTPASNFNVVSDTQLTATSPAGSGVVDVIVTAPGGTSATSSADQFTYTTPLPTVKAIKPNSGLSTGGTLVTIIGTDFTGATSVFFGQTAASNFTVVSSTQITVTSPVGNGTVDMTVTTPGGTSVTSSADQFTYIPVPIN